LTDSAAGWIVLTVSQGDLIGTGRFVLQSTMILDLNFRSPVELLAEFDSVFPVASPPAKKPMTYSKVEGEGRMIGNGKLKRNEEQNGWILLPAELNIEDVFDSVGRLLGERFLLILSSFYVRGLLKKKVAHELGNFFRGHNEILRRLGGEHYRSLIGYALKEKFLIKSPRGYVPGLRAKEFMLNQEVFSLKNQQRYELTTNHGIRVRTQYANERRIEFIKAGPAYRKIAASVNGLTFDFSSAIKYVAGLPDGEPKIHRKNVVESLILGESIWTIDEQKRNYTIMVVVPRDIRQFFQYGNKPLWVVDITSSQPLLHVLLYSTDCEEKGIYQSIVEDGRFWDYMNDAAGRPFELSDPEQKAELKESIYQQIFYSYHEPAEGTTEPFAVIFKREFPILWAEINANKIPGGPKQSGPLAKAVQESEANSVIAAIGLLKGKPYPLITIHDAVVTTKDGLADVEQALKKSFATDNLNPWLSVKRLTIDSSERDSLAVSSSDGSPASSGAIKTS
jgi:hypothetical protein